MPELVDLLSPLNLAVCATNGAYMRARHLQLLEQEVFATLYGDWDILVAMAPPREGKSEYLSRWLPTWYLSTHVLQRAILSSYSVDLARTHSRWVRDNVHKYAPWYGHEGVNQFVSGATDWETTSGGGLLAAGVGGGLTGRGCNLGIIDDPLKNSEQAISERIRDSQWEWWQTTFQTRLEPGGKTIILATRWHSEDLLGRILKHGIEDMGLKVREIRLPALSEGDGDPLGRAIDEPLWPERWPAEALFKIRDSMEPYWWNALYQQRLGSYGRNEWPNEYFYGIFAQDDEWPEHFALSATALDPSKGKHSRKGDYSAIVFAGYSNGYIWIDADVERRPVPKMISDLVNFNRERRPTVTGIESVAFQELLGESYIQAQQELDYHDEPVLIDNRVNKHLRIARLGFWLRLHRLKVKRNKGGEMLVKDMKEFPNGAHDDGCFDASTPILMADGTEKPIPDILPGEIVATRHGPREVLLSGCTGVKPVVRYRFGCLRELVATENHPVYHPDGYFQSICKASEVMICREGSIKKTSRLSYSTESGSGDIQNLKGSITATTLCQEEPIFQKASNHCTGRSGSFITGLFQKVITFITSMVIRLTIALRTLNAFLRKNMRPCITKRHLSVLGNVELVMPQEMRLQSGMGQKKVASGIASTAKGFGRKKNQSRCNAYIAEKPSKVCERTTRNIATTHVAKGTMQRSKCRLGRNDAACIVAFPFRRTSTQEKNTAMANASRDMQLERSPIVSRESLGVTSVYNLTVDGGEYIAAGVVVHNCDALEMSLRLLLQICDSLQEIGPDVQTRWTT